MVVADTYEAAREAANKVEVNYVPEPPGATFDSPGVETEPHQPLFAPDPQKGDAEAAFAAAPVKVEGGIRPRRNTTMRSSCSLPPACGKGRS